MDITVAICTYNGAHRVPDVLDCLRRQVGMEARTWEVLVIDNNSTDDTAAVVGDYQADWIEGVPLRPVLETEQGLAYARQRAVDEARGALVAFLDDDNLPDPDWVATACRFAETHPRAGAFGGQLHGVYEVEPPRSFEGVQGLFAINDAPETYSYSAQGTGEFAPGAGLVVRKAAWEAHVPRELHSEGVSATSRANVGEDIETQWYLHEAGWEIWHCADMKAKHKIPASRFSEDYLTRFFEGIGMSRHDNRMRRFAAWMRPLAIVAFWVSDARKLARHLLRYRHKAQTDPFVRGRTLMLLTMLKRPFMLNLRARS